MNKRQAKKQYKKIHGHNPPKTAVTKYTPEEIEMDIKEHTTMTFIPRGAADVPSLVGVWM